MSDESIQATAENLRADFLNATTTHQRWKVLNRAIDWAVAASENADHYRQKAQTLGLQDYEMFDRQVQNKMKHSKGEWFHVGWDGMVTVCEDKVNAGTLEKRYNEDLGRPEFRTL